MQESPSVADPCPHSPWKVSLNRPYAMLSYWTQDCTRLPPTRTLRRDPSHVVLRNSPRPRCSANTLDLHGGHPAWRAHRARGKLLSAWQQFAPAFSAKGGRPMDANSDGKRQSFLSKLLASTFAVGL